jgi:hypothetical protein
MADITRGKIIRDDAAHWDGVTRTASRVDATGGTVTGLNFGDEVDVLQVFGSGTSRTSTTISTAIGRLGGANATLLFSTGTWTITDDLTIPSNCTCHIPPGSVLEVASGKTLTINGYVQAGLYQIFSGSGSFAGSIRNSYVTPYWWGALTDGTTDNTTAVQSALDTLPAVGGIVQNPKDAEFNLSSLTFPQLSVIEYFGGDDISDETVVATNELRTHIANANPSGIVNEKRLEASFHPGQIVNVRKDITGHDSQLGGGQTKDNPARASYNIMDEDFQAARLHYEQFSNATAGSSKFTGLYLNAYVPRVAIVDVGTDDFATNPVVDDILTGDTSGARGTIVSIDANNTTLQWLSGTFVAGETLADDDESSSSTVTSATKTNLLAPWLASSPENGRWVLGGLRPGQGIYDFTVGGGMALAPTQNAGQHIETTWVDPTLALIDANTSTPNGVAVILDQTPSAASRRLETARVTSGTLDTTPAGHIGAAVAYCNFNDSVAVGTSAYNVGSVTKNATGDYTVNFTNAVARADFAVSVTTDDPGEYGVIFVKTTSSVRVRVYDTADFTTLVNLSGVLEVMCLGGDI